MMRRPPRSPEQPLFTFGHIAWSLAQGAVVLAFVVTLFVVALHQGLPDADARVLTFAALVVSNLGLVLVNRSQGTTILEAFRRRNATLWWVAGATTAVLVGIIAVEPARELFHFGPLHADDAVIAIAFGAVVLLLLSLAKRVLQWR